MRELAWIVATGMLAGSADAQPSMTPPGRTDVSYVAVTDPPHREVGIGYRRGSGLGWYGASALWAVDPRWTPSMSVFAQVAGDDRGFSVAPAIRYSFVGQYLSSPYVEFGMSYSRIWFGGGGGDTFGGSADFGWEFRLSHGIGFDLGIGLDGRGAIHAMDGIARIDQPASFGPHWTAALRYWLP